MTRNVDLIGLASVFIAIVPWLLFVGIILKQYKLYDAALYPLQLLNIRSALLLPLFGTFLCCSVFYPGYFHGFDTIEAALEGYCILCLYAMIITNCGGPLGVMHYVQKSDRYLCCSFQQNRPKRCYIRVYDSIWQFVYIRPLVILISTIVYFTVQNDIVFQLIQGIATVQTFYMLACFLVLVYNLYEECSGLCVGYKLLVIKISVGLVTLQGFVLDNLFAFGLISIPDEYAPMGQYEQKDRLRRAYCFLCLIEFLVLCIPLWLGFSPTIQPSFHYSPSESIKDELPFLGSQNISNAARQRITKPPVITFLYDICNIWKMSAESYTRLKGPQSNDMDGSEWIAVTQDDDRDSILN